MRPRNRNHRAQSSRQLDSGSSHAGSTRRDTALRRVESSVSIIRDRDVVAHQRGAAEMPASARPGPAPRTGPHRSSQRLTRNTAQADRAGLLLQPVA